MPKAFIVKKARDVLYLKSFYKKLILLFIIIYIIMAFFTFKIFDYNFYLTKNDYFVITTFGKLLKITPVDNLPN